MQISQVFEFIDNERIIGQNIIFMKYLSEYVFELFKRAFFYF